MSHKINEKAEMFNEAYGVKISHIDEIAEKLAEICGKAEDGSEPVGFVAKQVQEVFSKDDLEIIATMFLVKVLNENNRAVCNCPECVLLRKEDPNQSDMAAFINNALKEQFPNMEATVIKIPTRERKGKTDC